MALFHFSIFHCIRYYVSVSEVFPFVHKAVNNNEIILNNLSVPESLSLSLVAILNLFTRTFTKKLLYVFLSDMRRNLSKEAMKDLITFISK